jgi:hypothetical protein
MGIRLIKYRNQIFSTNSAECWEPKPKREMGPGLFEFPKDSSTIPYTPNTGSINSLVEFMTGIFGIGKDIKGNAGPFLTAPCDGVIEDRPNFQEFRKFKTQYLINQQCQENT